MLLILNYCLISIPVKAIMEWLLFIFLYIKLLLFESENFKIKVLNTSSPWQGCQKVPKYAPFLKQVANLAIFYERIREKPSKDME